MPFISAIEHPTESVVCARHPVAPQPQLERMRIVTFYWKKNREIDVRTIIHIRTRTVVFCFCISKKKKKVLCCGTAVAPYISFIHISVTVCFILFVFTNYYSLVYRWSVDILTFTAYHFPLSLSLSLSVFSVFLLFFILNHWFFYDSVNHLHNFLSYVLPSPAKTNGKEK